MSGAPSRFSSMWRRSGLNYLEMISVASTSMRQCLKEPMRSEALGRTSYAFREFKFENGVEQPPGEAECCAARGSRRVLALSFPPRMSRPGADSIVALLPSCPPPPSPTLAPLLLPTRHTCSIAETVSNVPESERD